MRISFLKTCFMFMIGLAIFSSLCFAGTFHTKDTSDTTVAPSNVQVINLTDGKDRDGVIHLTWNSAEINFKPAIKYEILILGNPVPYLSSATPLDPYLALDPYLFDADTSENTQGVSIDILTLIGREEDEYPGLENRPIYKQKMKDLTKGTETMLWIAIRASNIQDPTEPWAKNLDGNLLLIPVLDENGRILTYAEALKEASAEEKELLVSGPDGNAYNKIPQYTFVGSAFSAVIPVTIKLDPEPEKITSLVVMEKQAIDADNDGIKETFKYVDKAEVTAPVWVKVYDAEKKVFTVQNLQSFIKETVHADGTITNEIIDYKVYQDGDGILDLRWEDNGNPNYRDNGYNYPMYQIQISKWPVFYYEPTFAKPEVVNEYFTTAENAGYIYGESGNVADYVKPESYLDIGPQYYDAPKKPLYSKNLAVKSMAQNNEGDWIPTYYTDGDPYSVPYDSTIENIFYLRIRAIGKKGSYNAVPLFRENGDNRIGPWSDVIPVVLKKNERLPAVVVTDPSLVDQQRAAQGKDTFIDKGKVPLNWNLQIEKNLINPKDKVTEYPVYEMNVYKNLQAHGPNGAIINLAVFNIFSNDFMLAKDLGAGTIDVPHLIKSLFNNHPEINKVEQGIYKFEIRSLNNEPDSIPGNWSNQVSVHIYNEIPGAPKPTLILLENNEEQK